MTAKQKQLQSIIVRVKRDKIRYQNILLSVPRIFLQYFIFLLYLCHTTQVNFCFD